MKLTPHQEKIIEAIIAKDVYDIPSYLEHFKKSHAQQYDFDTIKAVFEQYEDGLHSAAPNGSWCGDQRQLSAANGTLN